MDVHDSGDTLEITAELPGVSQSDIDLRVDGDVLTIQGEKRKERKDEQAHIVERTYGSFQRSVQLPFTPDANQVQATFHDGVLKVTLPKQTQQEKARRIEVRGGQNGQAAQQTIESDSGASSNAGGEKSEGEADAESRPG